MLVAVCGAGAVGAIPWALGPLRELVDQLRGGGWAALALETALTALAAAVLAACAGWLTLATAAAGIETLTGASPRMLRSVSPALVRRAVAICCGLAVGTGGSLGATAEPAAPEPSTPTVAVDLLSGLPLPDRATGGPPGTVRPASPVDSTAGSAYVVRRSAYVVRRGDSLWAIASRLLGSPDRPRVDAAWRALYRANRIAVGDDPDLLRPGTALRLPEALTSPSRIDRKEAS